MRGGWAWNDNKLDEARANLNKALASGQTDETNINDLIKIYTDMIENTNFEEKDPRRIATENALENVQNEIKQQKENETAEQINKRINDSRSKSENISKEADEIMKNAQIPGFLYGTTNKYNSAEYASSRFEDLPKVVQTVKVSTGGKRQTNKKKTQRRRRRIKY
jgi:hypothetical protein